jgi:hypothetical protein
MADDVDQNPAPSPLPFPGGERAGERGSATDAEIYRVAIQNAGAHLGQWSKSALSRDAGRLGLAGVPVVFTEEDVRRIWKQIGSIGDALEKENCAI